METPQKSSKPLIYLIIIALLMLGILGAVYYYMTIRTQGSNELDELSQKIEANIKRESTITQSQLDSKDAQIQLLKAQNLKKEQDNLVNQFAYSIKPKEKIVAQCNDMKIGKWKMPKNCLDELKSGVLAMVQNDNKIVAFEISGIVDTLPYGGTSPELKQEGLASFRAKEAISIVSEYMPQVAAFEGLSQQKPRERGFVVRAFYVQHQE